MRDGWDEVHLGDVVTFLSGGTPKKDEAAFWDGDIPWISGATLTDRRLHSSDRRLTSLGVENGSRIAPAGASLILVRGMSLLEEIRIGQATRDLAFNQDVKALVPAPTVDPWFLTYALLAQRPQLLRMVHQAGHGTGVLATDRLRAFPIFLPPLKKQERIADVLGVLDDLIDANRALAQRARALAAALASTSPDRVPLRDVALVADVRQFRPDGPVDHFSIPAFDEGRLPECVEGDAIKSGKLLLTQPTVLVSRLNPQTPRIWMAYPSDIPAAASTEFVPVIATNSADIEEVWAVCALDDFSAQMRERVTGTTGSRQRVDKAAVVKLMVPDVRRLESSKRAAIVSLVRESHASLVGAAEAARTRDELLPLLLTGRVQVEEAA
jgi:type I restriction enzyme S subunit